MKRHQADLSSSNRDVAATWDISADNRSFMSIVAQTRTLAVTNLRIALWSAFLLVVAAPPLFERVGHPYYGAALLRPGSWILATISPEMASNRAVVLLNFAIYFLATYALVWLGRRKAH